MKRALLLILLCIVWGIPRLSAQDVKYDLSISNLEKGKEYCNQLDFNAIDKKETFLFCRMVYSHKFDFRKAHEIMHIAQRKYPYSYEVRLHKALALHELGSTNDATKELIGLIKLYPNKYELHNYLGRIQYSRDKTKALMPLLISVAIDPSSKQSEENLIFIKRLFNLKSSNRNKKEQRSALDVAREDDFDVVNHILADTHSLDHANHNENDWLINRIETLSGALDKTPHQKNGFFWEYYADYFIDLHKKNLVEPFVSKLLNSKKFEGEKALSSLNKTYGIE